MGYKSQVPLVTRYRYASVLLTSTVNIPVSDRYATGAVWSSPLRKGETGGSKPKRGNAASRMLARTLRSSAAARAAGRRCIGGFAEAAAGPSVAEKVCVCMRLWG